MKAAINLAKAMNRVADTSLPGELAGIVKLHSGIAVATAFIPVPGADMAASATNIWAMYVRMNKELKLPFSENIVKSLAAGVATNLAGAGAAFLIVGSAFKFLPGLGSLGGAAIMGGTVYGVTLASGIIYMNALAKLLNAKHIQQINEKDLKGALDEIMKEKDAVETILNTAKEGYKEAKKNKEI